MEGIAWRPDESEAEKSNVRKFMDGEGIENARELRLKSVVEQSWFWAAIERDMGFRWSQEYSKVMDEGKGPEWCSWFLDGSINIATHCLSVADERERAIIVQHEDGKQERWSGQRLSDESGRISALLSEIGISRGERVGLYMPMIPEAVAALFGILRIGAIAVPLFSGYGSEAIRVRMEDTSSSAIIASSCSYRRGRRIDMLGTLLETLPYLPSVRHVVLNNRDGTSVDDARLVDWPSSYASQRFRAADTASEERALILYSSGTTGKPKGTVHTHVGALIQTSKEVFYNMDVHKGERLLWITDMGWMMGPWQVIGTLSAGGTVCMMEGAIDFPAGDRIWEYVDSAGINMLGISPTVIRSLRKTGTAPQEFEMKELRILASTGEPWDEENWFWFFRNAGKGILPVMNISGGTEIIGCHLCPLITEPLKPCTLQGPGLGMDVDVFDDDGRPIRERVGYLVCRRPVPSMTKGFWNDRERYLETYWRRFPGIWFHGDWASVDSDGFWFLHGRADDVIKIAGKRLGPAEVEEVLMSDRRVVEAAAIGIPDNIKGEELICFVVPRQEEEKLHAIMADLVSAKLGKAFRPAAVFTVPALPKTRSGKISRGFIRRAFLGMESDDSSIENPEIASLFRVLGEKFRNHE